MSVSFNFAMDNRVKPKVYINVGCCLDIPSCSLIPGARGETIYNGGLGQVVGIVGAGNNFKSTLIHYLSLSAARCIKEATDTYILTRDTEMNVSLDRLEALAKPFKVFGEHPVTGESPSWVVTDSTQQSDNLWAADFFKYMEEKAKDKKSYIKIECMLDPYTKKPLEIPVPTFVEVDSLTALEADSVSDMLSGDLDSKDTNTYAMKQGLFKTKFVSRLPALCTASGTYVTMTAHTGGKVNMETKPWLEESKKLQHLKAGDTIKGTGSNFTFFTNVAYQAHTGSAFYNQGTKAPEYPRNSEDLFKCDLNKVTLTALRNKAGASGIDIEVLISQSEGVLPSLTEFHLLRTNKSNTPGWGISGNDRNYSLDLRPEVSLSRTTVRSKLDNDSKLRRAVQLTAELLQLSQYHKPIMSTEAWCSPAELYKDLKEMGYDWDKLLDTRSYWVPNQYEHPVPYLCAVDLLKMRKGLYHPWWYDKKDLKPLKKEAKADSKAA